MGPIHSLWSYDEIVTCLGRLLGLVARVPFYRFRGPGFDSPELTDFLRISESGMWSTRPREVNGVGT
jgi:hypothetical protein